MNHPESERKCPWAGISVGNPALLDRKRSSHCQILPETTRYSSSTGVLSSEWMIRLVNVHPSGTGVEKASAPFSPRMENTLTGQAAKARPMKIRKRDETKNRIFRDTAFPRVGEGSPRKQKAPCRAAFRFGGPGQTRTGDLRLRRPSLYPPELRAHRNDGYLTTGAYGVQSPDTVCSDSASICSPASWVV